MKNKIALILGSTALAITSTVLMVSAQSASAGQVQSQVTGRCLDGSRSKDIYTRDCEGNNAYQRWDIYQDGSSNWTFKSQGTALCLDSNNEGNVYTNDCKSGNPYQRWVFSSGDGGKYKNEKTGLCLDSDNNGNVYATGCTEDRTGQRWHS
jgi:Ricin-type beta-trefoil lectin domain